MIKNEDFKKILKEGDELFEKILMDLNIISDIFIHFKIGDDGRKTDTYRREEDYKEICIALALAKRKKLL